MSESGFNNEMWTSLLEHIVESRSVPKLQVERAIGPILGFFIEDVAAALLGVDRSNIVLLAPEFPLKKDENRQSNNVDWLIYKKGTTESIDDEIILFELKTEDSSFNEDQLDLYRKHTHPKNTPIWENLYSNFNEIAEHGHWKYKKARAALNENKEKAGGIDRAKAGIIYLCPESCIPKAQEHSEKFFSFNELSRNIINAGHPSESALAALCNILRKLDIPNKPQQTDNHTKRNYQEIVSYEDILNQARTYGSDIVIGYTGGEEELFACQIKELKNRNGYRWDWSDKELAAGGNKTPKNWIPGDLFLEIIKSKPKNN